MDMEIRPETRKDRAAIRHVNNAAFSGDVEANLVDALRDGGFAEVSLVAELDDEIVCHILFSPVSIMTSAKSVVAVSLAPMAVVPGHQREGIGSRLVKEGLEICRQRGHAIVVVPGQQFPASRFFAVTLWRSDKMTRLCSVALSLGLTALSGARWGVAWKLGWRGAGRWRALRPHPTCHAGWHSSSC